MTFVVTSPVCSFLIWILLRNSEDHVGWCLLNTLGWCLLNTQEGARPILSTHKLASISFLYFKSIIALCGHVLCKCMSTYRPRKIQRYAINYINGKWRSSLVIKPVWDYLGDTSKLEVKITVFCRCIVLHHPAFLLPGASGKTKAACQHKVFFLLLFDLLALIIHFGFPCYLLLQHKTSNFIYLII